MDRSKGAIGPALEPTIDARGRIHADLTTRIVLIGGVGLVLALAALVAALSVAL